MAHNSDNHTGGFVRNLLINTLSIFAVGYVLSGIQVDTLTIALILAVVMAILNVTLKPLLILITIPLTHPSYNYHFWIVLAGCKRVGPLCG